MSADAAPSQPVAAAKGSWLTDRAEFCAILCVIIGFLFCAAAMILGIDSVSFTGAFKHPDLIDTPVSLGEAASKEVGYTWAINWSFYGIIVMPLIVLFGLLTLRQIEPTIERIAKRGMVRVADTLEKVPPATLLAQWRRGDIAWRIMLTLVFVLGAAFIGYDGWKVVSDPISNPSVLRGVTLDSPAYEFDWSIACLYQNATANCEALRTFGMLGYALIPGVSTVFAFIVVVVALRFMAFIASAGNRRNEWVIVVDADDTNLRRFGWGAFEGFFSCLLYWALVVLFGLWLMVVQNSYLRDPDADSVFRMIFADSQQIAALYDAEALTQLVAAEGVSSVTSRFYEWIFAEPSRFFFANWQTGLGVVLFGFVCASAVLGSWWLLRATAKKSQQVAREHLGVFAAEAGLDPTEFRRKLKRMRFWPVAWIDQAPLFALMLVLFGSLFSYRLILVAMVLVAVTVLVSVLTGLTASLASAFKRDDEDE